MCKTGEYKKVNALFCAYTPASCVEPLTPGPDVGGLLISQHA